MPEVFTPAFDASIAKLRLLSREAKRRAIVSVVLCLVGVACAVGSAIFSRQVAGHVRTIAQANESLRQTNDELSGANVRLQSSLFEMQDANAALMQKMGDLQTADLRLKNASAELFQWDRKLKVRITECLR